MGQYVVDFLEPMPNNNYVVTGSSGLGPSSWTTVYIHTKAGFTDNQWYRDPTTTSFAVTISRMGDGNLMQDVNRVSLVVFGTLI